MTELSFAKSFLSVLDSKPSKISADHYEDPKSYPARSAYILPKTSKALARRKPLLPGQERSLKISLKSLRNPPLDIVLKGQSPLTSILDLKSQVSSQASIPVAALRLLHKKKPVADSKVLKDLVGEEDTSIEFSVMVMGGAAAIEKKDEVMVEAPVAQGPSGKEELASPEFWNDLKGFLVQRLRDEGEGEKLYGTFRKAYESSR